MAIALSLIGSGEAARAFAADAGWDALARDIVRPDLTLPRHGVVTADSNRAAVAATA